MARVILLASLALAVLLPAAAAIGPGKVGY
jgi:hypothetical protein